MPRLARSGGNEWIVDADLKHFFGFVNHEKKQIAYSRVLQLTTDAGGGL
jgi:hypothetical protein